MKKTLVVTAVITTGLAGCADHVAVSRGQAIRIDDRDSLIVATDGIETTQVHGGMSTPQIQPGLPVHRTLTSNDGKTLFAYDLEIKKNVAEGTYRLFLKPAKQGPTFAAVREVDLTPHEEAIRVELMEQPGTNRKVVDVFTLSEEANGSAHSAIMAHVLRAHEMFRKWMHGE